MDSYAWDQMVLYSLHWVCRTLIYVTYTGRAFGISMFHQIHCLSMIRHALINGADGHSGHCLNFLRQAILCNSDTTLDPLLVKPDGTMTSTNGVGVTHVCRDWSQIYSYVKENQNGPFWEERHNQTVT